MPQVYCAICTFDVDLFRIIARERLIIGCGMLDVSESQVYEADVNLGFMR